jgi:hypothetical protein
LAAWAPCPAPCWPGLPAGHPGELRVDGRGHRPDPGINQIIIYLVAIVILLTRPRGLMGRKGVMEE